MNDTKNSNAANTEVRGKRSGCMAACRIQLANGFNFVGAKLRVAMILAVRQLQLLCSIPHVVSGCSKKKVVRVNTCFVIPTGAVVKHTQPVWNWSANQSPRSSMRNLLSAAPSCYTIAILLRPNPKPAAFCFADVPPKVLRVIQIAAPTAVLWSGDIPGNNALELFSAGETFRKHLKLFLLGVKGLAASTASSCIITQSTPLVYV